MKFDIRATTKPESRDILVLQNKRLNFENFKLRLEVLHSKGL